MKSLVSDSPGPRRIKDWDAADRPREKFMTQGRSSLSDSELLAILIGHGNRQASAIDLARKLLQRCNHNLHELGRLHPSELAQTKGIGTAKAVTVAAALELGRRRKEVMTKSTEPLKSSRQFYQAYQHLFEDLLHEELYVVLLNNSARPLACKCISVGGITSTIVDVRKVFREVVQYQAVQLVLMHNHPSGNLIPSEADRKITQRIAQASALFEVRFVDHLIISNEGYYSFADQNERCMLASAG